MFQKLKSKVKNSWQKFKKFYKKSLKNHKVLTILLTIIAIPPLCYLLYWGALIIIMTVIMLVILGILFWYMFGSTFGSSTKGNTKSTSKTGKSNGETYPGAYGDTYTEGEIMAIAKTYPELKLYSGDWKKLAEAIDRSKYNKKLELMQIDKLLVYIFPRNNKPTINFHLLRESTMDSGGGLFEKGVEHFTKTDLNSGKICVIYDGKRLFAKDL